MKILFFCFLIFTTCLVYSQDLKNTEWIKIFTEKKDGSKVTDKVDLKKSVGSYFFKDSTVLASLDHQFIAEIPYHVENGILTIGSLLKFDIDTVNDIVLKLTEIPRTIMPDNEINTYVFINNRYLFEYLKENNQIKIIGDSLIQCNEKFAPMYSKNDLSVILSQPFKYRSDSVFISGNFIINPDNKFSDVHLDPSVSVSDRESRGFEKALKKTVNSWILPITDKPYSFKVKFRCFIKCKIIPIKQNHSLTPNYIAGSKLIIDFNPDSP